MPVNQEKGERLSYSSCETAENYTDIVQTVEATSASALRGSSFSDSQTLSGDAFWILLVNVSGQNSSSEHVWSRHIVRKMSKVTSHENVRSLKTTFMLGFKNSVTAKVKLIGGAASEQEIRLQSALQETVQEMVKTSEDISEERTISVKSTIPPYGSLILYQLQMSVPDMGAHFAFDVVSSYNGPIMKVPFKVEVGYNLESASQVLDSLARTKPKRHNKKEWASIRKSLEDSVAQPLETRVDRLMSVLQDTHPGSNNKKVHGSCGGPDSFMQLMYGEEKADCEELRDMVAAYLKDQNVEDKVEIRLVDGMLSAANVATLGEGRYVVNIAKGPVSKPILQSICDHEVGTHLLRMMNDEHQVWHGCRDRYKLQNPWTTEEGFATLNTSSLLAFVLVKYMNVRVQGLRARHTALLIVVDVWHRRRRAACNYELKTPIESAKQDAHQCSITNFTSC
ncbi:unnamed protein product [Symbiodinium pilosum]|uniref:Uncharacterized protein n=1 Tax=Symbiodinium pilosum TaxID=2952 RepID=A0A812R2P7_SYMPI|nr:unnamed protein product [Symbiodinium pilosum]